MGAVEAVTLFIRGMVAKGKRDRYAGYVSATKSRRKFLDALDHALSSEIVPARVVATLSEKDWSQPGFLYASDGTFGMAVKSLRDGYDSASPYGGWLILSQSAGVAIFRPEGRVDDELYLRL